MMASTAKHRRIRTSWGCRTSIAGVHMLLEVLACYFNEWIQVACSYTWEIYMPLRQDLAK